MKKSMVYPAQVETQNTGQLRVSLNSLQGFVPIENATIRLSNTGNPSQVIEELTTDNSGLTDTIELPTPPIDYSLEPAPEQPYSEYNIDIIAPGYENFVVSGIQLLPGQIAVQNCRLQPAEVQPQRSIVVPPHTLFGDFPPKIAESEIKPLNETGEIVLREVVIPETIVVHDGPPTDSNAANYYVPYKDYIKNVASSEIYATWPESTIIANVLAIMSFTLNRVYTEWYRNRGYNFTITNSTAYDHFFVYGRNIFENISNIVDNIFTNFLSRPNVSQPILTQYCDGKTVSCPNWMSQWGSKALGDDGLQPIEIIRYYYGDDMFINTAPQVSGIPSSWPGTNLTMGSSGPEVQQIQEQLYRIAQNYPALPLVGADGVYGQITQDAVREFQRIFGLPANGIVDYPTWYKISEIYVAVSRIAELN